MIKVRRIGHATFETPDLDKQIEHYTQVTGLVVAAPSFRFNPDAVRGALMRTADLIAARAESRAR